MERCPSAMRRRGTATPMPVEQGRGARMQLDPTKVVGLGRSVAAVAWCAAGVPRRGWQVRVPCAAGVRRVILVNVSPREGDVNVR